MEHSRLERKQQAGTLLGYCARCTICSMTPQPGQRITWRSKEHRNLWSLAAPACLKMLLLVETVEQKTWANYSREFSEECMLFFKSLASKPLERNPLKYPVVWYLSSLHPRIGLDPETALSFFEKLLQKLLSCRWLSAEKCDEAKLEFSTFAVWS